MAPRFPAPNFKPLVRCAAALAPGATYDNTDILYEVHAVAGCARVVARILTDTADGTIELLFAGPDLDLDKLAASAIAFASIPGTIYTTGNPAGVAVVAGTESRIAADCYGEGYVIVKFTGGGTGTITYCDIGRI